MNPKIESWGRFSPPGRSSVQVLDLDWDGNLEDQSSPVLAHGLGRSYGDSCLNDGGIILYTPTMQDLLSFDASRGILRAQAGTSIADVLSLTVQHGWFIPVTPGTKFVTLGGAVANDIHGKNHHRDGTFGRHVRSFELVRSSGERLLCSPGSNPELYAATIGGLGLTGLITWVEIQLIQIQTPQIKVDRVRLSSVGDMIQQMEHADTNYHYTVGWLDTTSSGKKMGRGVLFKGNHAEKHEVTSEANERFEQTQYSAGQGNSLLGLVPSVGQLFLNKTTIAMFNSMYYSYNSSSEAAEIASVDSFFYPLDFIPKWNRIYGASGMIQYQFVVPHEHGKFVVRNVLKKLSSIGAASFLSVLKIFGDKVSPGIMSFPIPGVTLALDIPAGVAGLLPILDYCDELVADASGRIYPAKDARIKGRMFARMYPQISEFEQYIDPRFSSSFWRRVTKK